MIRICLLLSFVTCTTSYAQDDRLPPPVVPVSINPLSSNNYGVDSGISAFICGYAKVIQQHSSYYIDENAKAAFDYIKENSRATLGNKYSIEEYQKQILQPDQLPWSVLDIVNKGKHGVLSPTGAILLQPIYDEIDRVGSAYWTISLDGKKSFYLPHQQLLPFFEDIGYLDGRYFDVKQQGKWGIYDSKYKKMVVKANYDGFDYCGGCSKKSDYVYASKDGKWGIINWNEEVLIPFEFDHQHRYMRSDNWVQSFAKDGQAVIVNVISNTEFKWDNPDSFLFNNSLIYKNEDYFGIYDKEGKLAVPFIYDRISNPYNEPYVTKNGDYLLVQQGDFSGVINTAGQVIIPLIYDEVSVCLDHFVGKKGDITYLLDKNNNTLLTISNAIITAVDESGQSNSIAQAIFKVKQRAYWGIYFADTKRYFEPQFYELNVDYKTVGDSPYWIVGDSQGVKTLIDTDGTIILPTLYNGYTVKKEFPAHWIQVKQNDAIGVYDTQLKRELIPIKYADYFDVIGDRKKTVICRSGDYRTRKIELRDWNGRLLADESYTDIISLDSISYLLSDVEHFRHALFNTDSRVLTPLPYKQIELIGSNKLIAGLKEKGSWILYHISRLKELPGTYQLEIIGENAAERRNDLPKLYYYKNGMGLMSAFNKYGFIDENGRQTVPTIYDQVKDFNSNGTVYVVQYNDNERSVKAGFIDKKGRDVVPLQHLDYNAINDDSFIGSLLLLSKYDPINLSTKKGLANNSGKVLINAVYDDIFSIKDKKYIVVVEGEKYGLLDDKGAWLIKPEYDDLGVMSYHFDTYYFPNQLFPMPVKKEGKWFYLTEKGDRLGLSGNHLIP